VELLYGPERPSSLFLPATTTGRDGGALDG
jgi:hypothetical protein